MGQEIWFDYRYLDFESRILECIKDYCVAYSNYCKTMDREVIHSLWKTFDIDNVKKFKYYVFFNVVTSYCDSKMLRYNEFWNEAFEVARVFDADVKSPLFFRKHEFMEQICGRIEKYQTLRLSKLPIFDACNYVGNEVQDAYYQFVCDYICQKNDSELKFRRLVKSGKINKKFLLDKGYISE